MSNDRAGTVHHRQPAALQDRTSGHMGSSGSRVVTAVKVVVNSSAPAKSRRLVAAGGRIGMFQSMEGGRRQRGVIPSWLEWRLAGHLWLVVRCNRNANSRSLPASSSMTS